MCKRKIWLLLKPIKFDNALDINPHTSEIRGLCLLESETLRNLPSMAKLLLKYEKTIGFFHIFPH